jgi:centriolar protein POC1
LRLEVRARVAARPPAFRLAGGLLAARCRGRRAAQPPTQRAPAAAAGADEQLMVWRTNFDRQLEEHVVARASRAEQPAATGREDAPLRSSAPAFRPPGSGAAGALSPSRPAAATAAAASSKGRVAQRAAAAASDTRPVPDAASIRASQPQQAQPQLVQQEAWSAVEAPPGNTAGVPDVIASQLQHLTNAVDMLTQTLAMLDMRMAASEDRLGRLNDKVTTLVGQGQGAGAGQGAGQAGEV